MVHSRRTRSISGLVLALAFQATAILDGYAVHECVLHEHHPPAAATQGSTDGAHGAHHHGGGVAHTSGDAGAALAPAGTDGAGASESTCTCLGSCQPGAGMGADAVALPAIARGETSFEARVHPQDEAGLPDPARYLLPYSLAPPRIA